MTYVELGIKDNHKSPGPKADRLKSLCKYIKTDIRHISGNWKIMHDQGKCVSGTGIIIYVPKFKMDSFVCGAN
jgi:hypothetical protein